MDAEQRKILSKLVLGIRHLLEGFYDNRGVWHAGDLEHSLNQIGVWRNRPAKPLEELPQLSEADNTARKTVDAYIKYREETGVNRAEAVEEFIRESAYTWFNRLFALRCMEARGIIDEVIHQKDIYGGRSLQHNRLAIRHPELCAGEDAGLHTVLFQEFERRAHELPMLFNPESPAVTLKPSVSVVKQLVSILSGQEPVNGNYASDETFMAPDAFGWAYQYWNAEEKDRVFERVRTEKVKIEGRDIIPVTCIYTEPYMVKFLVQNSLGAQWCCMHPESRLYESWEYYVKDADLSQVEEKPVREITFLDPACGSGHFLLEAFDLFYEMYGEEGEFTKAEEICSSILENNLFGIDIDERAVQISITVLWMKAKERGLELDTSSLSGFQDHLVATNIRLPRGRDHLEEFLRKHPEDKPLGSALESIFKALENVDEIGSLLKIEEPLEQAFERLRADAGIQTTLWSNGFTSVDSWRENLILQLKIHFNEEAESSELSQLFFGRSMNKGLRLIDQLSLKYDVVATNPPFMGSRNMGSILSKYVSDHYQIGKRDLYAAFMLRNLEFVVQKGKIGMVTQQSWMFLESYKDIRVEKILSLNSLDVLAHLGTNAFEEISGEIVNVVLFILSKHKPDKNHLIVSYRLNALKDPSKKNIFMLNSIKNGNNSIVYYVNQCDLLNIINSPIAYWVPKKYVDILTKSNLFNSIVEVKQGIVTGNNSKFIRNIWEITSKPNEREWVIYLKGGSYKKWRGFENYCIRWKWAKPQISENPVGRVRNSTFFGREGWCYGLIAQGSLSVRRINSDWMYDNGNLVIFPKKIDDLEKIGSYLNSHLASFLLRQLSQSIRFNGCYVESLPSITDLKKHEIDVINLCEKLKLHLIEYDILEKNFKPTLNHNKNFHDYIYSKIIDLYLYSSILHYYEYINETIINKKFNLTEHDVSYIYNETGIPVGKYPLIYGYDEFPKIINKNIDILFNEDIYIKHNRININEIKLSMIKNTLHNAYKKHDEYLINGFNSQNGSMNFSSMPNETFLEELSQQLQIHPISVYWLFKEGIEQGGWRCLTEEQRITEDRFTVMILRLLGHSWLRQIEAGELIPEWADPDGIIPLTGGTDESTLIERIRERIETDIESDSLEFERKFMELIGKSVEEWFLYDFFKHHTSQFKKRPIAWQIQSTPPEDSRRGRGRKLEPIFSCLVYYQKLDEDTLHKIRSQYVGPLKNRYEAELRTLLTIGLLDNDQTARQMRLEMIIEELEAFDSKLERVITEGFDTKEIKAIVNAEPLDKWCSIDGNTPYPTSSEEYYLLERAYAPDINDGVRVNIAPLQKFGLLANDVISKKDVEKAISDRAEWRRDERKWCRQGKLPQPGWWPIKEVKE